jgi:hypothetical protein
VLLLFHWLRPLIGDPVSVLGCAVVLFLGAATGDLVFAFQIGFFGSVVGGLGAFLLLRRQTTRDDLLACLLLVFSTLCSTLMAPFLAAAAVELLYRGRSRPSFRQLLRASWIVLVPFAVYLIWWAGWNQDGSQEASLENLLRMPAYILAALGFAAASLTGAFPLRGVVDNYLWVLPGIAVATGFVWILRRRRSIPPEFLVGLAGALSFWALCGLNYTEARDFFTSRYQYPSVVFLLMMLAGAFKGLRPDRHQLRWLAGLTVIAVVINIAGLFYAFNGTYKVDEEENLVNLAALDISSETVDPEFRVGIGTDGGGGQIRAADYEAAVARYGRPTISREYLLDASAENRELLDELLVRALPVGPLPASRIVADRGSCRKMTAAPTGGAAESVGSGLLYLESENPVLIRLSRYGPAPGPAASAAGRVPIGLRIPADRSDLPWRISFQGSGEVTVCDAREG